MFEIYYKRYQQYILDEKRLKKGDFTFMYSLRTVLPRATWSEIAAEHNQHLRMSSRLQGLLGKNVFGGDKNWFYLNSGRILLWWGYDIDEIVNCDSVVLEMSVDLSHVNVWNIKINLKPCRSVNPIYRARRRLKNFLLR